jgi:hypothetical protein
MSRQIVASLVVAAIAVAMWLVLGCSGPDAQDQGPQPPRPEQPVPGVPIQPEIAVPIAVSPAAKGEGKATVDRFASLEAPSEVDPGTKFAVLFSLTCSKFAPEAYITAGETTVIGQLQMALPRVPECGYWTIDVVLAAPHCAIEGSNLGTVRLPPEGDSTPLRFDLTAKAAPAGVDAQLHATLWHQGAFLGRATRPLRIRGAEPVGATNAAASAPAAAEATRTAAPARRRLALDLEAAAPDLTIYLRADPEDPRRQQVTVGSRVFQAPAFATFDAAATADWLADRLQALASGVRRGRAAADPQPGGDPDAALVGLGRELFERCAPPLFQERFWALADKLGAEFDSIAVFTDDPRVPWELMRPCSADGKRERGFLGAEFRLGRWHIAPATATRDRPPNAVPLQRLAVIAPRYAAGARLPGQETELQRLQLLPGYVAVGGTRSSLGALLQDAAGIVHFAGHGTVVDGEHGTATFAIELEDGALDLPTWRGLSPLRYDAGPLFFLNACEVGQARKVALFVDGWAPLVLELGAAGCIGASCPVGDSAAAAFAVDFYGRLQAALPDGGAPVAELLRQARSARLAQGDPSGLCYAYYGDPELRLVPSR